MATTGTETRTWRSAAAGVDFDRRFGAFSGRRKRSAILAGALVATGAALGASAQTWRFEPSIGFQETLTNNVRLTPDDQRRGDWVTQLTPGFRVSETGAHTNLSGTVYLPVLFYARSGSENSVQPNVNLSGTVELVDRLLFVESSIVANQQYLSPFGARSNSLANVTDNRYTSQTYRVSPYIKGSTGTDYSYDLRDDNLWTKGSSGTVSDAYTNDLKGTFRRDPNPLGWAVDVDRSSTKFQDQATQLLELARVRGLYQIDPQVRLSASGGYEHNDLLIETKENVIYGVGVRWQPSDRTNVDASWEHRFFGASYNFAFDHRTPLSVWSLVASRNITTYPQQLAALPGGIDVTAALNQLFLSRVTDPVQRATLVNQLIVDRGLPLFLSNPVTVYAQQIQLQESLIGTAGFLGARNSVFLSLFRQRDEPIAGSGNPLPPVLEALNNNTQYGGNIVWSHSLTPLIALSGSIDGSRTVQNTQPGVTKQGSFRVGVTLPLSALTSMYGGVRYQILRSTVTTEYDEAAVFVGVNHRFN